MNKLLNRILSAGVAFFLAASLALGAGSGSVVFDPSNYSQNLVTATNAVTSALQGNTSYILQLKQYATQLQNLSSLGGGGMSAASIQSQLSAATQYQGQLTNLYSGLTGLQQQTNQIYSQQAASGQTWPQYIQNEQAASTYSTGNANTWAMPAMQSMQNVQTDYAQIQAFQQANPNAIGSQAQTQLLNDQMSMLLYENRQIQSDLDALVAKQAEDATVNNAQNTGGVNAAAAVQAAQQQAQQQGQATLNSIGQTPAAIYQRW